MRSRNIINILTAMKKTIKFAGEKPDDMNYPIGIQTFEKIRTNDFAYVDKIGVCFSSEERGIKDWKVTT